MWDARSEMKSATASAMAKARGGGGGSFRRAALSMVFVADDKYGPFDHCKISDCASRLKELRKLLPYGSEARKEMELDLQDLVEPNCRLCCSGDISMQGGNCSH